MAAYFAVLEPGDRILGMNLAHGGHLTHGSPVNFSGQARTRSMPTAWTARPSGSTTTSSSARPREVRPKLIVAGASRVSAHIDFERMAAIAHGVGALLFVDMAHIAGLVAAGLHPSPFPHADIVTTTTHKTLRGPAAAGSIFASEATRQGGRQDRLPGRPGWPADARHRRQGGGAAAWRRPTSSGRTSGGPSTNAAVLAADARERGCARRLRRHRQPPHARRRDPARRDRPRGRGSSSTRSGSPSTRTPSRSTRTRPTSPRAFASARRPRRRVASGPGDAGRCRPDRRVPSRRGVTPPCRPGSARRSAPSVPGSRFPACRRREPAPDGSAMRSRPPVGRAGAR